MKKVVLLQTAVITILVLTLMSANQWLADVVLADQGNGSNEGQAVEVAQFGGGSDEVPPSVLGPAPRAVANAEPTTPVYFSPQDSDGTATVVSLNNTTAATHTIDIQAFDSSGSMIVNSTVTLGPFRRVYLVSDSVAASPPPSWDSTLGNIFLTNFTDFSNYAVMSVPQGVKFDGYVVFNLSTGTIDPKADQGAIPLRFSTDPLSVLLPAVRNSP